MNVTKKTIEYCAAPYGFIATIPAGTQVDPATNLPGNQFWACAWETMDDTAAGWHRNYGFLIQASDVETVPDPEPESAIDPACECTECG
jgi:hypothetical protein